MTTPTPREIADLTARLRTLTGRQDSDAERVRFLADKAALLDRIRTADAAAPADEKKAE